MSLNKVFNKPSLYMSQLALSVNTTNIINYFNAKFPDL